MRYTRQDVEQLIKEINHESMWYAVVLTINGDGYHIGKRLPGQRQGVIQAYLVRNLTPKQAFDWLVAFQEGLHSYRVPHTFKHRVGKDWHKGRAEDDAHRASLFGITDDDGE